jgi:hypothetical protein
MRQFDFRKYWYACIHWKGWKRFANGCKHGWKRTMQWQGWRKIFFLPFPLSLTLFAACMAALLWVFLNHVEQQFFAYGVYALSAYLLLDVCIRFPSEIKNAKAWLARHPKIRYFLKSKEILFTAKLYAGQMINFAYGIFKIVAGVVLGSAWIGCDGIYNMAQALIQLFQILRRKKVGDLQQQWQSYRFCGVLILLMHLTLIGIVFQTVNWNRVEQSGEIMVIATAFFAFYKLIGSFVELAKDRKHTQPLDSSVRMLELSQAFFAIFSLQASMLHTFGSNAPWEHWVNLATGCAVCLLTVAMGMYMIRRANRELRKIQEIDNGKSFF